MTTDASLASILANLESQIAMHREQKEVHAQQETFHREQKELHAAELEALIQNFETLRAAAAKALDLAARSGVALPPPVPAPFPDPDPGRKPRLSRMVSLVVASWPAGQPFGTSGVTAEVHRRYKERLRKPPNSRMVSMHLRRLLAAGKLAAVRDGRPHHEALYTRPA
jgi:hypothetical protein